MRITEVLNKALAGRVKSNEPLAQYTSYKIGGSANYYFRAESLADIKKAVQAAKELDLPYFILARGSNILIADQGFSGLVIHNKAKQYQVKKTEIIADSGINLSQLANIAKRNNLSGIEFGVGIPGSLGGAVRGNAGAFGGEMKDIVKLVGVLTKQGEFRVRTNKECQFAYRESIFKQNQEIILYSVLELKKSSKEAIQKKINQVVAHKKYEQEFESPSAGCIFKNPEVTLTKNELTTKGIDRAKIRNRKIPAGYLIEKLGLKGFQVGQVMVSKIHGNFLINLGGATAEQVVILIGIIKQKVRNKFGIQLQEEIQYVGFDHKG